MIGVDVCAVERVEKVWKRHKARFEERLLAPEERAGSWTADKLARRWALKEAVAKALGTGIGATYGFQDIIVEHDGAGKPCICVRGTTQGVQGSVSDDAGIVVAVAVLCD